MMDPSDEIGRAVRLAGPRPPVPADRTARVMAAARQAWEAEVRSRVVQRRRRAVALIACAAVAVLAIWTARPDRAQPAAEPAVTNVATLTAARGSIVLEAIGAAPATLMTGDPVPAGARLRTEPRAVAALAFERGASFRLDEDTRVRFVSAEIVELERGAIYLDSGSAASGITMTVVTRLGTLRDIGTQFEVRLFDDRLRLRVREGTVRFERGQVAGEARAGVELIAPDEGAPTTRAIRVYGADWAWIGRAAPPFSLQNRTLAEFLEWVSRETGHAVSFRDPTLAERAQRITLQGSIDGLPPEDAPAVVLPASGLAFRIDNGTLIVGEDR